MTRPRSRTMSIMIAATASLIIIFVAMGNVQYNQGVSIETNAGDIRKLEAVKVEHDLLIENKLDTLEKGQIRIEKLITEKL